MVEARPNGTDLEDFLGVALHAYGLSTPGRGQKTRYVDVPVVVSSRGVPVDEVLDQPWLSLSNPFRFLDAGEQGGAQYRQGRAQPPFAAFIVGEYGVGKTELVHQLCESLLQSSEADPGAPRPLPLKLGPLRRRVQELSDEPDANEFGELLFGDLLGKAGQDESFFSTVLLPRIGAGHLFVFLDGLDEAITTASDHHRFLAGLNALLRSAAGEEGSWGFRVAIGVRLEYFRLFGVMRRDERFSWLESSIPDQELPNHYFLRLPFFDEMRTEVFLEDNLRHGSRYFREIESRPALMSAAKRPLLLRILADLAADDEKFIVGLPEDLRPVELIEHFVKRADADPGLTTEQLALGPLRWNLEKLTQRSLEAYCQGRNELDMEDLRFALEPTERLAERVAHAEILKSVHKCPFLGRPTEKSVEFAHQIFVDYFVAKGICDQEGDEKFDLFDDIVLTVEMRQFLHDLMERKERGRWYARTKKSYGLLETDQWNFELSASEAERLEILRRRLLDSMTYPEATGIEFGPTIEEFLERDSTLDLHPRYRTYNYEAVSVWLSRLRRRPQAREMLGRFEKLLQVRWNETARALDRSEGQRPSFAAYELLCERILSVAFRLHMPSAQRFATEVMGGLEERMRTEATRRRLLSIAREILRPSLQGGSDGESPTSASSMGSR